jgi:hypothetical protein
MSEPVTRGDARLVLAATAAAALLRFAALGHESLWLDEAYSLDMARAGYLDLLSGRIYDPGNPAGYFLLLRAWLDLFGSTRIETARALSALAGTLAVPAVWLLARALAVPRRAAWLACGLVALSPPLVYLSQEARAFALLATVATLAAAAAARIERDGHPLAWAGFAAAGVGMVHLHYYGFFVLTVLGLDLLVWACQRGRSEVLRLALASAVVALGFAPYLPTFIRQLGAGAARNKETWWQHLALLPSFSVVGRTLVWKEAGLFPVAACAALVVVAVFVPLTWLLIRSRPLPRLAVVFALGLPSLVGLVALKVPMVHSHYLSVVFPALLLLIACALDAGLQRRARLALWVPAAALVVLMPVALARLYLVRHKTDRRAVAAAVGRHGGELPVYFYEDLGAGPFAYYLPGQPATNWTAPAAPAAKAGPAPATSTASAPSATAFGWSTTPPVTTPWPRRGPSVNCCAANAPSSRRRRSRPCACSCAGPSSATESDWDECRLLFRLAQKRRLPVLQALRGGPRRRGARPPHGRPIHDRPALPPRHRRHPPGRTHCRHGPLPRRLRHAPARLPRGAAGRGLRRSSTRAAGAAADGGDHVRRLLPRQPGRRPHTRRTRPAGDLLRAHRRRRH